jgi:hypothetical protein
MNAPPVQRCVLCGDPDIEMRVSGRFVTTACRACLAILKIEFNPPDEPHLRARIEQVDELD